jgi:predicted AAA+ superfamily ATPase
MVRRHLADKIQADLRNGSKVVVVYGARQVGKTTLVKSVLPELGLHCLSVNADDRRIESAWASRDLSRLELLTGGYDLVFLDEAQRIPDIGLSLKLLHDAHPELRLIITGSSSLEIASSTKESLTGRTFTHVLYPFSLGELTTERNRFELDARLEEFLRFGLYPEVFDYQGAAEKERYLAGLCDGFLYRDILELAQLKHGSKLQDLLKLLAFQMGNQVSLSELGASLGLAKETVAHYIDLLEQSFVVFRLRGFSRNLRKEMTKMDKVYFYDCGVRNSVIGNHKALADRADVGQLWENFLISERLKALSNRQKNCDIRFWRTNTGAELDMVEDMDGHLSAYEFKWTKEAVKAPASWTEQYPDASWQCINRANYLDWLLQEAVS